MNWSSPFYSSIFQTALCLVWYAHMRWNVILNFWCASTGAINLRTFNLINYKLTQPPRVSTCIFMDCVRAVYMMDEHKISEAFLLPFVASYNKREKHTRARRELKKYTKKRELNFPCIFLYANSTVQCFGCICSYVGIFRLEACEKSLAKLMRWDDIDFIALYAFANVRWHFPKSDSIKYAQMTYAFCCTCS